MSLPDQIDHREDLGVLFGYCKDFRIVFVRISGLFLSLPDKDIQTDMTDNITLSTPLAGNIKRFSML